MRILLILLACLLASLAHAETYSGRVVAIADGDTLTVLDGAKRQHKIRLGGIDAPEKRQPYGARSKQHLSDLVFGKEVEAECVKIDRYKREVCKIVINGIDANLEQVKAGMALVVSDLCQGSDQDRSESLFSRGERRQGQPARAMGRG